MRINPIKKHGIITNITAQTVRLELRNALIVLELLNRPFEYMCKDLRKALLNQVVLNTPTILEGTTEKPKKVVYSNGNWELFIYDEATRARRTLLYRDNVLSMNIDSLLNREGKPKLSVIGKQITTYTYNSVGFVIQEKTIGNYEKTKSYEYSNTLLLTKLIITNTDEEDEVRGYEYSKTPEYVSIKCDGKEVERFTFKDLT